jgi:hypothetical protein
MTELEILKKNINLLDNFYETARNDLGQIQQQDSWLTQTILDFFKQSTHITFCLLSNSEGSKFRNENYVIDIVLIGTLGRLLRDIYLNIIYLKSTDFSTEDMKACWDFQIICQQFKLVQFEKDEIFDEYRRKLEVEKDALYKKISQLESHSKKKVLDGKYEKLLTLQRLAEIKGFNKDKFENEFGFFSQFSHSTAYANSFIQPDGLRLNIVAIVYDKLLAYFIAIIVESLELLKPDHPDLASLKIAYNEIIKIRWN